MPQRMSDAAKKYHKRKQKREGEERKKKALDKRREREKEIGRETVRRGPDEDWRFLTYDHLTGPAHNSSGRDKKKKK